MEKIESIHTRKSNLSLEKKAKEINSHRPWFKKILGMDKVTAVELSQIIEKKLLTFNSMPKDLRDRLSAPDLHEKLISKIRNMHEVLQRPNANLATSEAFHTEPDLQITARNVPRENNSLVTEIKIIYRGTIFKWYVDYKNGDKEHYYLDLNLS